MIEKIAYCRRDSFASYITAADCGDVHRGGGRAFCRSGDRIHAAFGHSSFVRVFVYPLAAAVPQRETGALRAADQEGAGVYHRGGLHFLLLAV